MNEDQSKASMERPKQIQIPEYLARMDETIEALENLHSELVSRLEPITVSIPPSNGKNKPEEQLVALAENIGGLNRRIEGVIDSMRRLLDGIQI